MTPRKFERIGLGLYLLGLLVCVWEILPRLAAEKEHQSTEIVLDAAALVDWQKALGDEGDALLQKLLDSGVSSLAFSELRTSELLERGLAAIQSSSEFSLTLTAGGLGEVDSVQLATLQEHLNTQPKGTFFVFNDSETPLELLSQLKILFGEQVEVFAGGRVLWLPEDQRTLQSVGLGFERKKLEAFHQAGFSLWLRPENRPGMTESQLESLLSEWGRLSGVQGVIFGGGLNEALGYPNLLEASARELEKLAWKLGYIELPPGAQQDGIETMVRLLPGMVVRVMAVSPPHQAKLSAFRVLGMYSLGARERNIRVLYVRPYAVPGRSELDEEFLFSLSRELKNTGPASVFGSAQNSGPSSFGTFLVGLSAGALALLLLSAMGIQVKRFWWLLLFLPPLIGGLATLLGKGVLYRSLLALAIGMGAPLYAFLRWVYPSVSREGQNSSVGQGVKLLLVVSLMSLSAGLYIAALLSDTTFLLGLDRFRGVKILTLGTPILILLCFIAKRYNEEQIVAGLRSYIAVYQALLGGFLLLVFGFLYLRTGNDAGGAVSESERNLRVILDKFLGVRPRFKEFMLAHPALVCIPLLSAKTGFLPALVLVLLAGIGQAGIVDTFAHLHTPLQVTFLRVGIGVGLGAIVGMVLAALFSVLEPQLEKKVSGRFATK